jgi:hypothetical protein
MQQPSQALQQPSQVTVDMAGATVTELLGRIGAPVYREATTWPNGPDGPEIETWYYQTRRPNGTLIVKPFAVYAGKVMGPGMTAAAYINVIERLWRNYQAGYEQAQVDRDAVWEQAVRDVLTPEVERQVRQAYSAGRLAGQENERERIRAAWEAHQREQEQRERERLAF